MTRITLDKVMTVKGFRIAALVSSGAEAHMLHGRLLGWGGKEPVAILIDGPAGMRAFDLQGAALDRAAVEALAPGVWAAFAQTASTRGA